MALPAFAHQGTAVGRRPFVDDDGFFGAATSWGIVTRETDGWLRVCEEALGGPPGFYYWQPSTGDVLIGRADGVRRTTDLGCTLEAPHALADGYPSVGFVPRDAPGTLFVATSHPNGNNGVYRSDDEGESFTALGLQDEDVLFRTLVASHDATRVWVAGFRLADAEPFLWVSADGGATFAQQSPWPDGTTVASLVGLDDESGRPALVLPSTNASSSLALLALDGSSIESLGEFDGVVTDFVSFAGRWLVIEDRARLLARAYEDTAFTEVDGPVRCLVTVPRDPRLWGCVDEIERQNGAEERDGHFLVSEDGVTWSSALPFDEVKERLCPTGTPGNDACTFRNSDGGVPDTGAPPTGGGPLRPGEDGEPECACINVSSRPGAGVWLVLLLFALARRRRRAIG